MTQALPVMYGISNCDTIKKARKWLDQYAIHYRFHDYKKEGVDSDQLQQWINELGWQGLINRRSTSWRKLDEQTRTSMDEALALSVMLHNPSIIKRPLLIVGDQKILGFNETRYAQELLHA